MFEILLWYVQTGSWKEAFERVIPLRKIDKKELTGSATDEQTSEQQANKQDETSQQITDEQIVSKQETGEQGTDEQRTCETNMQ